MAQISATSNRSIIVLSAAGLLCLLVIGVVIVLHQQPKIGYIRSKDVLFGYTRTKDVQRALEEQVRVWENNIDVLANEYSRSVREYEGGTLPLSDQVRQQLQSKEATLQEYIETMQQKADDTEKQKLQEILEHINTVVGHYAEEHGYTFIFGTAAGGNIVYGEKALDVTDEILRELNTSYQQSAQDTVGK